MSIENCPDIIKEKVKEYLNRHEESKVIGIEINEGIKPYKNKSITRNKYIVAIEWGNLCISMTYSTCTKPEWNDKEVNVQCMTYAEILNIVNNSLYLKNILDQSSRHCNRHGGDNDPEPLF